MTEYNGEQHLKNILLTFQKKMCVCVMFNFKVSKKAFVSKYLDSLVLQFRFPQGSFKIMTSFPYLKIGSTYAFLAYITYRSIHCTYKYVSVTFCFTSTFGLFLLSFSTYIPQSILYYHLGKQYMYKPCIIWTLHFLDVLGFYRTKQDTTALQSTFVSCFVL